MQAHPSGMVVDDGDVEAFSASLVQLYRRSGESPANARARADSLPREFRIDHMVQQYETLYGELLEGRRKETRAQAFGLSQ
jgi:hypothetical protein